jgi:hypothetical protein
MTRFDLEQAIMSCWNTCEDIKLVSSKVLEGDLSSDEISNALIGIEQLHELRCDRVFEIFEELIRRGYLR